MSQLEIIHNFLSIAGIMAFAVSGAMTAIDRELDLFGVVFIGCVTATGGGITRDVLTGVYPPWIFSSLPTLGIAFAMSILTFVTAYYLRGKWHAFESTLDRINNYIDAVGLAAFTVTGTEIAIERGYGDNAVLTIFLAMTTGVGGGVLRDMMTCSTPYIFRKHIYALATIFGSAVYLLIRDLGIRETVREVTCFFVVLIIRVLATRYHWEVPKIRKSNFNDQN